MANPPTSASIPPEILQDLYVRSGRNWLSLGIILLTTLTAAVWVMRNDATAVAASICGLAALVNAVPRIIDARTRMITQHSGTSASGATKAAPTN